MNEQEARKYLDAVRHSIRGHAARVEFDEAIQVLEAAAAAAAAARTWRGLLADTIRDAARGDVHE